VAKSRLGKGIDALLQGRDLEQLTGMSSIVMVPTDRILPGSGQPRQSFPEETLKELAQSITEKGILQPILAEDRGDGTYKIIAGERRYRAAKLAGLTEVPVISQDFSDEEKLEIALVENLQREDLNPIDEARAIQAAIDGSGATQETIARRIGKSRSAIANSLRLLKLEPKIRDALVAGTITSGHARALLAISNTEERMQAFQDITNSGLTVRESEAVSRDMPARRAAKGGRTRHAGDSREKSVELKRLEEKLIERLGTKVRIKGSNSQGKIELSYYSTDDLERLIALMGALPED
jgi:ParB family chromosome partitioning protein